MFLIYNKIVIVSVSTSLAFRNGLVTFEMCLVIDLSNDVLDSTPKAEATRQKIDGNEAN